MATLSLRHVSKVYDKTVKAVQDFNLEIADREFIVLVGPSGCGKSTTLRMVAGLEEISGGEIYIGDRLVNKLPPKDRDISMVFQNYALYPHMTVYQNLAYGLKLRHYPKRVIDEKVREAARILEITELLDRKPKALSGGQRQRVAIGRAIVREASVFLMDEPLSNLDAKLRTQMRTEILKLRKQLDTTFIYVTHDQTEAMTLGDRIVIMKDGFVQQIGTPREVFYHPANLFVGGFIGSPQMNFFDAQLLREGEQYLVELEGHRIALPQQKQDNLWAGQVQEQPIVLGVRPEYIQLCPPGTGLHGIHEVTELMGSSVYLHVLAAGKSVTIVQPLEIGQSIQTGAEHKEICFTFPPEAMHLFSTETEKNLEYLEKQ